MKDLHYADEEANDREREIIKDDLCKFDGLARRFY